MGFLRHQPDFKIAPDRLCLTSQRRHRRRMAGTAAPGFQSCHRRRLGVHALSDFRLRQSRPLPCPEQFVKERELGFQRLDSALTSGLESAFSLNFSDVSIFGLLQTLPGFC